jgi:hypothetical protein
MRTEFLPKTSGTFFLPKVCTALFDAILNKVDALFTDEYQ